MIDETFKYFWRRTVPGGIWWENKVEMFGQFGTLIFIPMFAIGLLIGRIENMPALRPVFEAYSHTVWYVSFPASVIAFALASAIGDLALFLALKALGFAIMVWRYRKFMELAEREWLLALTDQTRPTCLGKEEWLLDRIDELAEIRYQTWLDKRFAKRA